MTLANDMPDRAVLVAIDIAKHCNEILIEMPGRVRRRRLTVLNTRADHDRLVDALEGYDAPVVAGFEATGNYHRPLAHRLLGAGIELGLISSLALARMRTGGNIIWATDFREKTETTRHGGGGKGGGGGVGTAEP